ncbi:MAG: DUF4221 domain-containing protein [Bacteroidales bacterium]|nr:DUF4221 domain-containing protein [Bacteroidales bacterium]
MKKICFILWTVLLGVSCSKTSMSAKLDNEVCLVKSDRQIKLSVASDACLFSNMFYFADSISKKEYIGLENPRNGFIDIYDVAKQRKIHRVIIAKSGNNGIPHFLGHKLLSEDRLVVASAVESKYYMLDYSGNILRTFDFKCDKNGDLLAAARHLSSDCNPIIFRNNCFYVPLFLPVTRYVNNQYGNGFKFEECPLLAVVDTASNEVVKGKVAWPQLWDVSENRIRMPHYSSVESNGKIVYAMVEFDDVVVAEGSEAKYYHVSSKFEKDIRDKGTVPGSDYASMNANYFNSARYGSIFYDEVNKVYYRIVYHATETTGNEPNEYRYCRNNFSIMIIDEALKLIGETYFERGQYAPALAFVNRDGLWLSENNYERDDMTDDELVFRCLKLELSAGRP